MVELQRQLLDACGIDINQRNFVRGIYDLELKRFASGLYADLRTSSPGTFLEKEIEYLETLVASKEQHLKTSLLHIAKGRRKQIILFLDNADQRDEGTQELAFLIAQELAESWPMLVFVALRPETFHRSKKIGALAGYHAKAFTIAPPRIDQVLKKRLDFALTLTSGTIAIPSLTGVAVNLSKLTTIMRVVRRSLDGSDSLLEFIENIAAGNVRLALDLIRDFIGSGHVDTQKILDIEAAGREYTIPIHELLRAIIYGDAVYYDPSSSPIANLFDISSLDGKEHFVLPLLLGVLHRPTGPDVKEGFAEAVKVYETLQSMGYTPEQVDDAISRGCERNLIETNSRRLPEPGQFLPSSLRITSSGEYHLQRLSREFQYLDAVVVDTPILDAAVREVIVDAWDIERRLDRAEVFARYLDVQWRQVEAHAVGFDWHLESLLLKDRISRIRDH
jgi:hypothetical protein